ncbi:LOB domain-containing protein 22-like [Nymphaea colorata]|uniref:LOB domain-containing protein 22-like n=1 Tax=Nymphaea colorata TaxID=210225 RepID=UPI00129D84BC|nr:LOB domain-containing protein 22-like [Nymphaea colorata]
MKEKPSCASCKHQRRRCNAYCPLAPYFPHDRLAQFLNVRKLFGVSNVLRIIKDLEPQQRDDAMRTIIFEAEVRARDPVRGCLGVIEDLQRQINWSRAELEVTLAHLRTVKQQRQTNHGIPAAAHLGGFPVGSFSSNRLYGMPLNPLLHTDGGRAGHGGRNMAGGVGIDI